MFGLKTHLVAALAGALMIGSGAVASAGPSNSSSTTSGSDLRMMFVQNNNYEIIRRKNVDRRVDRRGNRYDRRVDRRGDRYDRRADRRWDRNDRRRYAYDHRYHGSRYRYARPGYRHYHDGYWYSSPWWGGAAGLAVGAMVGSAIANSAAAAPPVVYADDHVAWCSQRYRSYNPNTDTFVGYDGIARRCISP